MYSTNIRNLKKQIINPFVLNKINNVREVLEEKCFLSCFSPIRGNDYFKAGRPKLGFHLWANNQLSKIEDLYNGEVMKKFEELQVKFGIPKHHNTQLFP